MAKLLGTCLTLLVLPSALQATQTPLQPVTGTSSGSGSSSSHPVNIWHRVIPYGSSSSDQVRWSKRGSIHLPQEGQQQAAWHAEEDAFAALADDGDLYQIGFEGKRTALEPSPSIHSFVSIPECYLYSKSEPTVQDVITLNVHRTSDSLLPTHLSYAVKGTYATSCQAGQRASLFNTTVALAYPDTVDGPRLHKPVVVQYQPDGTVKEPEPERSFLQKYWMWLIPIVLLLVTGGSGGDEGAPARR